MLIIINIGHKYIFKMIYTTPINYSYIQRIIQYKLELLDLIHFNVHCYVDDIKNNSTLTPSKMRSISEHILQ